MKKLEISIPKEFESTLEFVKSEQLSDGIIDVYVNFLKKVSPSQRGKILLDLEDTMCIENKQIRIWHIPLGDKNSLRNLRGIKIKNND